MFIIAGFFLQGFQERQGGGTRTTTAALLIDGSRNTQSVVEDLPPLSEVAMIGSCVSGSGGSGNCSGGRVFSMVLDGDAWVVS